MCQRGINSSTAAGKQSQPGRRSGAEWDVTSSGRSSSASRCDEISQNAVQREMDDELLQLLVVTVLTNAGEQHKHLVEAAFGRRPSRGVLPLRRLERTSAI